MLREQDDIVVCPVCATPQHRECWMQNGHCANDSLHSSGYVWSRQNNSTQPERSRTVPDDTAICHICGSENPADALHCGGCGALLSEEKADSSSPKVCGYCGKENDSDSLHCKYCGAPISRNAPFFSDNPYIAGTGISPDEKIGDLKAGDVALYTQAASKRYLPKFKRFANGKKLSFNFAAFFLAPYWFFFRKIYKAGIFFIVLFSCASLMLSGPTNEILDNLEPYVYLAENFDLENATDEEYDAFEKKLTEALTEAVEKSAKSLAIIFAVNLAIHLLCALLADRLYYNKMKDDFALIDEGVKDPNMRKLMITRRGGLSALAFAASIFGYNSLVQLLAAGASMIMNSF